MLHDDFFYVVHPPLSFPPHLLAGIAFLLLSAGISGAEQAQLHLHPGIEHTRGLDLHRLDHRASLGALLGFSTTGSITGATNTAGR